MNERIFHLWSTAFPMLILALIAGRSGAEAPKKETGEHRIVPLRPMTGDVEVLYGDPEVPDQPFVMRIRELPGTIIPPHRHLVDEHITVVQGTIFFGVGDTFDRALAREIETGGYAFIPKGSTMFGFIPDGAIVQVHGTGPFHIFWRSGSTFHKGYQSLDDEGAAARFKFKKGERVLHARGSGRIRQGLWSGEVLQYEVDGDDGSLFMANEEDLRRP